MEFQSMAKLKILKDLPKEDALDLMIRLQKELNATIYPTVLKNLNVKKYIETDEAILGKSDEEVREETKELMTKEYLLAIIRECCEALDMINSKAWRKTIKKVDIRELKFEFIDLQHFINSLYDIWGMDRDEVLGIFMAKYKENQRRHENGY